MVEFKSDELDNQLTQMFQEEALKIVPPPSLPLWDNIQQGINKNRRAKIWRKHLYQAGAAAACLLLVAGLFYYAGTHRNGAGQNFSASMQSAPSEPVVMENATPVTADTSQTELSAAAPEPSVAAAPAVAEDRDAVAGAGGASDDLSALRAAFAEEDVESEAGLAWYDEKAFFDVLAGLDASGESGISVPAGEAIYYFPTLPGRYSFRYGAAEKNGRALLAIYQEYEIENGTRLVFSQFFPGLLSDSLYDSQQGTTFAWEEGNCVYTLSGELDDTIIEDFLNNMAKVNPN